MNDLIHSNGLDIRRLIVVLIFFMAIIIRFLVFMHGEPRILSDSAAYLGGSKHFMMTGDLSGSTTIYPPIYKFFIGMIHSIFNNSNKAVVFFQMLFGILDMMLLYLLASRIFVRQLPVIIATFLFALNAHLLGFEQSIMGDSLHVFTTLLYIWLFVKMSDYQEGAKPVFFAHLGWGALVGLVFFMDVATRQISQFCLVLLIIFPFILAFFNNHQVRRYRGFLIAGVESTGILVVFTVLFLLVSLKMKMDTGIFGLSSVVGRYPGLFKGHGVLAQYLSLPLNYLSLLFHHPIEMLGKTWAWTSNMLFGGPLTTLYDRFPFESGLKIQDILPKPFLIPAWLVGNLVDGRFDITRNYIYIPAILCLFLPIKTGITKDKKSFILLVFLITILLLHVAVAVSYWTQSTQSCSISSYRLNLEPLMILLVAGMLSRLIFFIERSERFLAFMGKILTRPLKKIILVSVLGIIVWTTGYVVFAGVKGKAPAWSPIVMGVIPWNNEKDVSVNTEIVFSFSMPMDMTSIQNGFHLKEAMSGKDVPCQIYWNGDTFPVIIPRDPLKAVSPYVFTISNAEARTKARLTFKGVRFITEKITGQNPPYQGLDRRKKYSSLEIKKFKTTSI